MTRTVKMSRVGSRLLLLLTFVILAARADVSVPASAPSATTSAASLVGTALQSIPLQPYLVGTFFEEQPLENITYRFVGYELYSVNQTFKDTVEAMVRVMAPNATFIATYRPGVEATIYGPDGLNGTGSAFAPTPGTVPVNFGARKMLGVPFDGQAYANRYVQYTSIDVEIIFTGNASASLLQLSRPGQWNGYLAVQMAQQGITVAPFPLNISTTSNILNVTNRMPLATVYVLGTILQITGTGQFPVNTQVQSAMYMALNSIFGSQQYFLFNHIQALWHDAEHGTIRMAVLSYTTSPVDSMNEIAGGDLAALMAQIAQAAQTNFSVLIVSSHKLGTQAQQLTGDPSFMNLDVATAPVIIPSNNNHGLSNGVIGGITGAVVAFVLAVVALALIALRMKRKKRRIASEGKGMGTSGKLVDPILSSDPNSSSSYTIPSSGDRSSSVLNSGSNTTPSSGQQAQAHPLSEAWNIDPAELAVCQFPDGSDWLLGTGSFGQVFRGLRGGVQDVAIKQLIKPGNSHLRMFEKEVALLRHLNFDRNLVQFYGACIADGNLMLVLEYMDGGDLRDALGNDGEMRWSWHGRGGHVLCDIARGLHFLHSNKVAHRDLKTKNILMTKAGSAKIGDVGLAKLVGSQLLSTQLDTAGTFAYAAPELLMGEPCDTRADLFSFGVIMWEVLTHEIPVRGNLRGIHIPEEAPQEVANLIERCLRRCPAERPNAKDIFDQLRALLPSSAGPRSVIMNTARSGSLAPVVESEERNSSGSLQSGESFLEYEGQFRRPGRLPDYTASDEGGSTLSAQGAPSQLSSPSSPEAGQNVEGK